MENYMLYFSEELRTLSKPNNLLKQFMLHKKDINGDFLKIHMVKKFVPKLSNSKKECKI